MQIYITVDTECTEERLTHSGIRPPLGYDIMMWGRFANSRDGLGLDFILQELDRFRFPATFFVEALCAEYFGVEGLAGVCSALQHRGHDVQLHLHPNFRRPTWRAAGGVPLPDNIGEYGLVDQVALLTDGIQLLERCGVPRDTITAFRAGNYGASNVTWSALKAAGLLVDSSLNLCYLDQDCLIRPDVPRIDLYEPLPGVFELPISCFIEMGGGYRHLEITAISSLEMTYALDQMERAGVRCATIVLHPAEFFTIDDHRVPRGHANRINARRFTGLLEFLDRERTRFVVQSVGELARALQEGRFPVKSDPGPIPRGSFIRKALRLPVQAVKQLATRPRR
jgi:hypothetical protein